MPETARTDETSELSVYQDREIPEMSHYKRITCKRCGCEFFGHCASKYCDLCKVARKIKPKETEVCAYRDCRITFEKKMKVQRYCCPEHKKAEEHEKYLLAKAAMKRNYTVKERPHG